LKQSATVLYQLQFRLDGNNLSFCVNFNFIFLNGHLYRADEQWIPCLGLCKHILWQNPMDEFKFFWSSRLKGEYQGLAKQKFGKNYEVTVTCEQTLSSAEFESVSSGGSISNSESISFEKHGIYHWKVFINYKNLNSKTPDDTKDYFGSCVFDFSIKKQMLVGIYYTSKQIFRALELIKIKYEKAKNIIQPSKWNSWRNLH